MGGDGGDGSGAAGGDAGPGGDPGNEGNQSGNDPSASLGDFGGFGADANAAAAEAAQTGYATGLDGVSTTGYGNFGLSDAPTGNNPAAISGFGASPSLGEFGDAAFGMPGEFGGFGVSGYGTGISGFGGIGGFGNPGGFSTPGGFGDIGVGTANDSIAGIATSMGLGINDSTDAATNAANIGNLGAFSAAALGTIGSPAAPASSPAIAQASFNDAPTDALSAITAAISAPVSQSFSTPASPAPTNSELGVTGDAAIGPSVAQGLGTIASNQAQANLAQSQADLGLSDPGSFNSLDAMASPTAVASIPGSSSIGIGSPSAAASVGAGPSSSPGVGVSAPSIASAPGQAPSSAPSVSAALAAAMNADTGFGQTGSGLNFINPTGSILLAQYPWLGFQPTS